MDNEEKACGNSDFEWLLGLGTVFMAGWFVASLGWAVAIAVYLLVR